MSEHLENGRQLQGGKYRIVRFISSGGFGCTYEGFHTMLNSRVAIKEFYVSDFCNRGQGGVVSVATNAKRDLADKLRNSFIKEARAVFEMQHPNIVRVMDIFEENGTAYYVMDYIDGMSLQDMVKQDGPLPEQQAVDYIRQVADALVYVHSRHRLHLDIKPGNIMLNEQGEAVLIDFGASKHYDQETHEQTSTLLGLNTRGYAPAEQMSGSFSDFNPATDIYALGATLYKLLTGITPPDAVSLVSQEAELEPLPQHISAATRRAVMQAMEPIRRNRPQSISEFVELLDGNGSDNDDRTEIQGAGGGNLPPTDNDDHTVIDGAEPEYEGYQGDYDYDNSKSNSQNLVWIWILLAVLVVGGVCAALYFGQGRSGSSPHGNDTDEEQEKTTDAEDEEPEDTVDYEAIYKAKCDSLYKNFTTPSLKFAQVKGFVKSIDMSDYGIKLNFDKQGKLTSMTNKSAQSPEFKRVNCNVKFNSSGFPSGYSYSSKINGLFPDCGEYTFTYSDDRVTSVRRTIDIWEEFDKDNYTFGNFNSNGLPTTVSYRNEGGYEDGEYTSKGSWSLSYSYDSFGNWISAKKSGSIHEETVDLDESRHSRTIPVNSTLKRTITYYSQDEIDFSQFIQKKGK